ncbi:MAG: hypothetical protein CL844_01275 [Crocinitomicaceae bacterium]|nr:hypothetical protein [Crocinitomicaceae bacterium]|tara:strand:- start:14478 stop:15029 length:552 start_codon:yes stop_codon:yes gene_type:complete
MRITIKTGIVFALLWIIIKIIFFYTGAFKYNVVPSVFINILCLLLAITVGLYKKKLKDTESGNTLRDIKNGMSAGITYSMIVSLFIFFYYSKIDPEFNKHQISKLEVSVKTILDNPQKFEELKNSNEALEVMTKEDIYNKKLEAGRGFYNPMSTMTISMLAMLLLTTMNSILISLVLRKIIFR